jgi:hypothetical protein
VFSTKCVLATVSTKFILATVRLNCSTLYAVLLDLYGASTTILAQSDTEDTVPTLCEGVTVEHQKVVLRSDRC